MISVILIFHVFSLKATKKCDLVDLRCEIHSVLWSFVNVLEIVEISNNSQERPHVFFN